MPRNFNDEETSIRLNAAQQHIAAMNARIKQIEDQHKDQSAHQMAEIGRLRHMEDSARALCTLILSKDRKELVLGTDYTWSKLSTEELIHKTVNSFKEYCVGRTKDLQRIKDFAIQKNDELLDAQEKIQELLLTKGEAAKNNAISEVVKEKLSTTEKELQKAFKNMNVIQDEDEQEITDKLVAKTAKSINEDIIREQIQKGYNKELKARSIESEERRIKRKHAEIDNVDAQIITLEGVLSDDERTIIRVIGKHGLSLSNEIRKMSDLTAKAFREALMGLDRKNIITTATNIYIPLSGGTPNIHVLTPIGQKIYKLITNEYPAEAEATKIKNKHATFEHGYGIRVLQRMLVKSKRYDRVNWFVDEIDLGNGVKYVPDIMALYTRSEDGTAPQPDLFEYERVKQTPEEYNAKFNKMAMVTDGINVVVSSSNDHKHMQKYMYEWAQRNKDNPKYSDTILRLTSLTVLKTAIEKKDFNDWWSINTHISRFPAPDDKKT